MSGILTESGQFTICSELWGLMRIARIARPGALYGALASAQTFETIEETTIHPIDFESISDVNMARATSAWNYPHMPGFEEYGRKFKNGQRDASRVNLS